MDTLKQVAEDVAPFVGDSGACPGDAIIITAINNARRILYELGEWKHTRKDIVIQSYGGTITLPNELDFIVKSWYPRIATELPNEWFSFIVDGFDEMCASSCRPIKMNEPVITFRDLFMSYPEEKYFRVEVMYEDMQEASDLEVALHGYNKIGGRQMLTRDFTGPYESVTANPPDDVFMRSLNGMTKPVTKGRVRIYEYIPATTKRLFCGIFEKDDINPKLTRYNFTGGCSSCRPKTVSCRQFLVTAKKKYRPLVNETDELDIATDAMIHTLQALTARKARNIPEYNAQLGLATGFLQRELGKDEPYRQAFVRTSYPEVTNLND